MTESQIQDEPAIGEMVKRERFARQFPWTPPCDGSNERSKANPFRPHGNCCQRDPGIVYRKLTIVPKQDVVPDKETISARFFRFMGKFCSKLGWKIIAEIGNADAKFHKLFQLSFGMGLRQCQLAGFTWFLVYGRPMLESNRSRTVS